MRWALVGLLAGVAACEAPRPCMAPPPFEPAYRAPLGATRACDRCALDVRVVSDGSSPDGAPDEWQLHDDGFAWELRDRRATIFARTPRGARYAEEALRASIAATHTIGDEVVADWPAFDVRGVIEGFYNNPFSVKQRETTLRLMHQLRQNTYLYAPKDDLYSSLSWATPYPPDRAAALASAAAEASALGIDFVWGAAPVLAVAYKKPEQSIRFSSDEDFERLVAKLERVRALGIDRFALLFDDVPAPLFHEADRAAFPTAAAAHASLANRLAARLDERLLFVGRFYTRFDGWEAYNDELGLLLDPRVEVMWTGPTTFSSAIPAGDIREINDRVKRPVVIWDNWPIKPEPFTGRDPALSTVAGGFLSNATMVGDFGLSIESWWRVLGPIAEYAWRPDRYAAESAFASWGEALPASLDCARQTR